MGMSESMLHQSHFIISTNYKISYEKSYGPNIILIFIFIYFFLEFG